MFKMFRDKDNPHFKKFRIGKRPLSFRSIKCILLSPKQKSHNLIESKMCSVQGNSAQFRILYFGVRGLSLDWS